MGNEKKPRPGKSALKGAEAFVSRTCFAGIPAVKKERLAKKYRPAALDARIRATRTKIEARLLHKAKLAGVSCPFVLEVLPFSITMTWERGKMLHDIVAKKQAIAAKTWKDAGRLLARLHNANIVHGDYTPANLMLGKNGELAVIDFGLGTISHDAEDYAVDVLTMKKALQGAGAAKAFLSGYATEEGRLAGGKSGHFGRKGENSVHAARNGEKSVLLLLGEIENRGRYQEREE